MTVILLLRHGQSTWNVQGRWQGRADPPLTELGENQAVQAANHLGSPDAIVSSPLQRAYRSADLIAERLGIGPIGILDDLAERDVGPWSGMTTPEIELQWPGAIASSAWPEGFEPEIEVTGRALRALVSIHERFDGGEVVALSHGGLIRMVERHFNATTGHFPNLSGRVIVIDGNGIRPGDRLDLATVPNAYPKTNAMPEAETRRQQPL